jgi:hypothetical protein
MKDKGSDVMASDGKTPAWLFRGQSREHPSVSPTLARLDKQGQMVGYAICRDFNIFADGVTGFHPPTQSHGGVAGWHPPSQIHELAMLQHYFNCSPVIDFSGTPEVALYFALDGAIHGSTCVIYALSTQNIDRKKFEIADHDFLVLPVAKGGLRSRWVRQDGFGVCPKGWKNLMEIQSFDLLKDADMDVCTFPCTPSSLELVSGLGNLLDVSGDPLPQRIKDVLNLMMERPGFLRSPSVDEKIEAMKTPSRSEVLVANINTLIEAARVRSMPETVAELKRCRQAIIKNNWDTSWQCSLDALRGRLGPQSNDA